MNSPSHGLAQAFTLIVPATTAMAEDQQLAAGRAAHPAWLVGEPSEELSRAQLRRSGTAREKTLENA